jgi:hypothetical protein
MVQTRKNKNDVATAPFTTPPRRNRPSTLQTPGSAASVLSETSVSTTTSARRTKLPVHLLSQLAEHIEAYGGIETHTGKANTVARLLNHLGDIDPVNRSLYKGIGDPLRKRISQKVWRWQKASTEGRYETEVLQAYNVKPARERATILQIPLEPTPSKPLPPPVVEEALPVQVQEETTLDIPDSVSFFTNVSELIVEEDFEQEEENEEEPFTMSTNDLTLSTTQPWTNKYGLFVLMGTRSKKNDEELCTRLDITVDIIDLRDYQNGKYKMSYVGNGDKIVLEKPAVPLYQHKTYTTLHQSTPADKIETKIIEQHQVVCTTLNNNDELNQVRLTFKLPDGIQVSNEAFNPSGSGNAFIGTLGRSAVKSKDKNGNEFTQSFYHVKYSMVVKGTTERMDTVKKNKEEDELANLITGTLNIEEDDV